MKKLTCLLLGHKMPDGYYAPLKGGHPQCYVPCLRCDKHIEGYYVKPWRKR